MEMPSLIDIIQKLESVPLDSWTGVYPAWGISGPIIQEHETKEIMDGQYIYIVQN